MTIVWKGAGIMVPIAFFVTWWIVGYWFDDDSFFNKEFLSWFFLWAGSILTLIGLLVFPTYRDSDTGKLKYDDGNTFMWIPILVWGLGFLAYSINCFNQPWPEDEINEIEEQIRLLQDESPATETTARYSKYKIKNKDRLQEGQQIVKLYNPFDHDVEVNIYNADDEVILSGSMPAYGVTKNVMDAGAYKVVVNNHEQNLSVDGSRTLENYDSDHIWVVFGAKTDLMVVDVTSICIPGDDEVKELILNTDWTANIYERFSGKKPFTMHMTQQDSLYFMARPPYYSLPLKHGKHDQVYCIIPIEKNEKESTKYIADFLYDLCFVLQEAGEKTIH